MATVSPRRIKWPQLGMRTCFAFIIVGLSIEVSVIMLHIVIKRFQKGEAHPFNLPYTTLFSINAVIGLLGTLVLVIGFISLIRTLRVSKVAMACGYASSFCIVCYKVLDLLYSLHAFSLENLLGITLEIDALILNLLLISSIMMLVLALACALIDLHKTEAVLKERNLILDQEIQERRLLSAAIENAAEAIQIVDASNTVRYVNSAFERLMGYTKEEVLGQPWNIIESKEHDEAYYKKIADTITEENVWRGCLCNKKKNGDLINVEAVSTVIKNKEDAITHYITMKRDVTREKILEQQAQQSQKLEAIGTLAGGIAHDLNNVLAVIIGHSEMSMSRLEPDHPVRKSLEVIMRTANRSSQLIKRLLAFSRQGVAEPSLIEPAPLVQEQMKVIRSYLPSNIKISHSIEENVGCILGEPVEIQQLIFNLCTNANHAMQPEGGDLEIVMDNFVADQELPVTTGTLKPGEYVRLRVRDTGCGMDETIIKRLFEPFFTTKEVGMGTGLGLPMVHGSIMRSGGAIEVISTPGKGSRFDLYWPKLVDEAPKKEQEIDIPDGKGRTVLVVDDMEDFKDLVEMNLTAHGFKTVGFADTETALDYFRSNSDKVDIALVDYMMPGMNGAYLAECLHETNPDLPIVLVSGYSCTVTEENAAEYGFAAALSKPVETAHLVRVLCWCLPT